MPVNAGVYKMSSSCSSTACTSAKTAFNIHPTVSCTTIRSGSWEYVHAIIAQLTAKHHAPTSTKYHASNSFHNRERLASARNAKQSIASRKWRH